MKGARGPRQLGAPEEQPREELLLRGHSELRDTVDRIQDGEDEESLSLSEGLGFTGTPGLSWHDGERLRRDLGGSGVAQGPQDEVMAGPSAAGRMTRREVSAGASTAMVIPAGRCVGVDVAPPVAAFRRERQPSAAFPGPEHGAEGEIQVQARVSGGALPGDLVETMVELDYDEDSMEEGELREELEDDWWSAMGGVSNPVIKSFQTPPQDSGQQAQIRSSPMF
ncbi:hypothetical protein NDU88_005199 [Pleurodeles waltl]|uniref:Uncharacterized protein n=1 Tax=Pleurodeles waltl TaxID=8319 RepID=A0AAV7NUM7_PLEWA|nr:hypothetical protein NDU88_005199 [Pleurodeles waltl]